MRYTILSLTAVILSLATIARAQSASPSQTSAAASWVTASSSLPPSSPAAASAASGPTPLLLHTPVGNAPNQQPLILGFQIVHPELVDHTDVHYRIGDHGTFSSVVLTRAPRGGYHATLPAAPMAGREIDYYVTFTRRDGTTQEVFASFDDPHRVVLQPTWNDSEEVRQLAYVGGQRREFIAGGDAASFGWRNNTGNLCGQASVHPQCFDYWYSVGVGVEYRFLRFAQAIIVHVDRLGGENPHSDASGIPLGFFSATADMELRIVPHVSGFIGGTIGANQNGVTGGAEMLLSIGVDSPTRVDLRLSGIFDYGVAFSAWMRWRTLPQLPMGVGIEITNQPGAGSDYGVRLLGEVSIPFWTHFTLTLRAGYAARYIETGGPTGAAILAFHF